ncbi:cryptochrome/photolyase family protein [Candidatus Mycobacterium methanotrophicum]|uniref:DNA photolyase family protein n=1 Tax=Candidatus Mycobacterium methanotrophicum TaxID=2943498 RepID=A0ABY4QMH2_9MYCO|nr:deoxyribodipyrimidine photo-lyase [Candidatus Mycobacterium methanotrophicum]UQX11809.1 DNA photolyase family protein [Candidatus Mycobacterium methanotrophicum]
MPALLWFRRDLRLHDLPALLQAVADSQDVLACFVLDPRLEASSGARRMQFMCDSLRRLRDDLDGRLLVTRGRPEERIPAIDLPAGEASARRQWKTFVDDGLERYSDDRNRPDLMATSRMSAHLKFGAVHPRTMAADLDQRRAGARAYLRELGFRDFYAAVRYHWPDSVWWNWSRGFDAIETDTGAVAQRRFAAWKVGETGFPIVDAGMRQLRETGFMHNRVRMIVASFLVKDLHLPWQWGARWFLDQLVDGDMASNQHGWQWCAGCGTDAAPYFRVFNPAKQAEKFDPTGGYIRRWIPQLADADDVGMTNGERPSGYPEPIVDHNAERSEALRRYREIR